LAILKDFSFSVVTKPDVAWQQSLSLREINIIKLDDRSLTHYRPAMTFGNRKIYFRGSFQFSLVTI